MPCISHAFSPTHPSAHTPAPPALPCSAGYTINSSKVIFLRRRPQLRPPKGAVGASLCTVCSRHLQDVSLYCSLQCKLDCLAGVRHVSLRKGTLQPGGGGGGEAQAGSNCSSGSGAAHQPDTPSHFELLRQLGVDSSGGGGGGATSSDCDSGM